MPRTTHPPAPSAAPPQTRLDPDAVLRPGTDVLWRGNGELQLGTDPRWAVRLDGLQPAETRWLGSAVPGRRLAPGAHRHGVPTERAAALLAALRSAGLVVDASAAPATGDGRDTVTAAGGGAADVPALGALNVDGDATAVLAARAARCVQVVGLGRTGAVVATTLAAAGVGTLVLDDDRAVQATDVTAGAYRLRDVGRARAHAIAQAVEDVAPRARVVPAPGAGDLPPADLVVLVEHRAPDVARAQPWMGRGTPHLSVTLLEAGALVGPLVLPGVTACLRCRELHRRDDDAGWPSMAVQLRDRYRTQPGLEETVTAGLAGALAAAEVLTLLDGTAPRTQGGVAEVLLPGPTPRWATVAPHPACGCTVLPTDRSSGTGRGSGTGR